MRRGAAKLHRSMRNTTEEPIALSRYKRFGPSTQGARRRGPMISSFLAWAKWNFTPCTFGSRSKRLQHHEENDEDQENRRHLVNDPIKTRRSWLTPSCQPTGLARKKSMQP